MATPKFLLGDENTFQKIGYLVGLDFEESQDFAQDVRCEYWERTGTVPLFLNPDPYTFRGLLWDGRDKARRNHRLPILPKLRENESFESYAAERLPAHVSAEVEALRREQLLLGLWLLSEGLLSLSVDLRDTWILREIVELDYPEIVKELGLRKGKTGINTAIKRTSRAEQQLTAFFRQHQCTVFPCKIVRFLLDFQEENAENAVD